MSRPRGEPELVKWARKSKTVQAIANEEGRQIYQRNRRLIDWNMAPAIPAPPVFALKRPDFAAAKALMGEFDLQLSIKKFDELQAPIERFEIDLLASFKQRMDACAEPSRGESAPVRRVQMA